MALDDYNWRQITFQGVTFPPTLMAISILDPVLGITKRAPAEQCARCARLAADLMLEHRQQVLDGIRDRLAEHGFDPETTYRDWLLALRRIAELSAAADADCVWSAPVHPRDPLKTESSVQGFVDKLTKHDPGNTAS
jgi:hypothetical protein